MRRVVKFNFRLLDVIPTSRTVVIVVVLAGGWCHAAFAFFGYVGEQVLCGEEFCFGVFCPSCPISPQQACRIELLAMLGDSGAEHK